MVRRKIIPSKCSLEMKMPMFTHENAHVHTLHAHFSLPQEQLKGLEGLLDQFYNSELTVERRREIGMSLFDVLSGFTISPLFLNMAGHEYTEEILTNWKREKNAWTQCIFFMGQSSNQMVIFYCCTVFEVGPYFFLFSNLFSVFSAGTFLVSYTVILCNCVCMFHCVDVYAWL